MPGRAHTTRATECVRIGITGARHKVACPAGGAVGAQRVGCCRTWRADKLIRGAWVAD